MSKRFDELDSLRGLASSAVLFAHLIGVLPGIYLIYLISDTPLHVFWAGGHEAVILFFILSGFVLSQAFLGPKAAPKYKDYVIRRICRIYIPYVSAILLSFVLMHWLSRMPIDGLSTWFNGSWVLPTPNGTLINHLLFLGEYNPDPLNPVIWSLIYEMRISLIFPVLMFFIVKYSWQKSVAISIACTIVYYLSVKLFSYSVPYIFTIHYIAFFIFGALLAKHRQYFQEFYLKLSLGLKIALLAIGVLAYSYTWWFFPNVARLHLTILNDWFILIGGAIFIVFSLNSKTLKKLLLLKPVHFIGKISYSLYLFHMPLIMTLINVFYGKMPVGLILTIAFVGSFILAAITYYLIEKPSISLGKYLTSSKKNVSESKLKNAAQQTI